MDLSQHPPPPPSKPKAQRASTSTKNRTTRSPSPYRSLADTTIEDFVNEFWQHTLNIAEHNEDDFKHQALPLARIKKVAKMDPDVQMISSEVTVLFEKACQIFIQELTARAHLVSLASRRRTLSRADVAQAVSRSDMFDFLIDIVPREERNAASASSSHAGPPKSTSTSSSKRPSRSRKASQRDSTGGEEDNIAAAAAYGMGFGLAGIEGSPPSVLLPPPAAPGSDEHDMKRLRLGESETALGEGGLGRMGGMADVAGQLGELDAGEAGAFYLSQMEAVGDQSGFQPQAMSPWQTAFDYGGGSSNSERAGPCDVLSAVP
ncbi:hypothetical protein JCM1841_004436 [Sporobolomyces salmonicolor]